MNLYAYCQLAQFVNAYNFLCIYRYIEKKDALTQHKPKS